MKRHSITQLPVEVNKLSASVRRGNNPERVLCVGAARNTPELASTQPAYLIVLLYSSGFKGPADLCERQRYLACMQNICAIDNDRFTCWKDDPKPRSLFEGGKRWTGWSEARCEYLRRTRDSKNQGGNIAAYAYEPYELVKSAEYYIQQASKELHQVWHERTEMNGNYKPETFRIPTKPLITGDQSVVQPQAEIKIRVHKPFTQSPQRVWKDSQERLLLRSEGYKDSVSFSSPLKIGAKEQRRYEELLAKWIVMKEGLDQPEIAKVEANAAGWQDINPVAMLLSSVSVDTQHKIDTVTDEVPAAKESGHRPAEEQDSIDISRLAEHESSSAYACWLRGKSNGIQSHQHYVFAELFSSSKTILSVDVSRQTSVEGALSVTLETYHGSIRTVIDNREELPGKLESKEIEETLPLPPKLEQKNNLTPSVVLEEVGSPLVPNNLLIKSSRGVLEIIEYEGGLEEGFVEHKGVFVPWSVKDAYDAEVPW